MCDVKYDQNTIKAFPVRTLNSNRLRPLLYHPQRPQHGRNYADGGHCPDDGGDGQAGVEGSADDAGGEGAAEVEEHEVAGEDAAAHLVGRELQEQVG